MYHLQEQNIHPAHELGSLYAEMNQGTSRLAFRVQRTQLEKLRGGDVGWNESGSRPSLHSLLLAHIIIVLNRYLASPITTLTNAVSVRPKSKPVILSN